METIEKLWRRVRRGRKQIRAARSEGELTTKERKKKTQSESPIRDDKKKKNSIKKERKMSKEEKRKKNEEISVNIDLIKTQNDEDDDSVYELSTPPAVNQAIIQLYTMAYLRVLQTTSIQKKNDEEEDKEKEEMKKDDDCITDGSYHALDDDIEDIDYLGPFDVTLAEEETDFNLSDSNGIDDIPSAPSSIPYLSPSSRRSDFESLSRESGYQSNLELNSFHMKNDRIRKLRFSPRFMQRSEEELHCKGRLDFSPLPRASSSSFFSRSATTDRINHCHDLDIFLSDNVYKTKYVTCVFEAHNAGIEMLMDDVITELQCWFGKKKMMGVACEVHWSVPQMFRNRQSECKFKEVILNTLLENNRKILDLKGRRGVLPIKIAESRTEENISKNKDRNTIEGVYQREYLRLLPYINTETTQWHRPFWQLSPIGIQSNPSQFLFGGNEEILKTTSLVAVNIVALKLRTSKSLSQPVLLL